MGQEGEAEDVTRVAEITHLWGVVRQFEAAEELRDQSAGLGG